MVTPATTVSVSDVHTELARSFTFRVQSLAGTPSIGVQSATSTTTPMRFYMGNSGTYASQLGQYLGTPYRLQNGEAVIYNSGTGAISRLTNGATYYIRDFTVSSNNNYHTMYFRLAETPGGAAITGGSGNVLTNGNITFTRPLVSVSLGDPKVRHLAQQGAGAVSMSNMRSKNRASITNNSAWSYSVVRRKVPGYDLIYTGSSGILTRCPAYYREWWDEEGQYYYQAPYNFDSTDFYVSFPAGAIDPRASNQTGNLTYVLDFSYNTYYVQPAYSLFNPIPFLQPGGYSTNYPNNDPPSGFWDYANPYQQLYFNQMYNATTTGTGTNQYRRGLLNVTLSLAGAANNLGGSWSNTNAGGGSGGVGFIGYWNTNTLLNGLHMISYSGKIEPVYGRSNENVDALRIYGLYIGLNYGL